MRSDLPPAVARAIDRAERPSLVFDRARIEVNFVAIAAAARAHGVTALFAAKSFPHPVVRALAARHLAGFDAASQGELAELPAAKVLSIADPTGRAIGRADRVIVSCETTEQVRAAPASVEIAIRISASITGRDPAIGAILDGTGHRRSRFGVEPPDRGAVRSPDNRGEGGAPPDDHGDGAAPASDKRDNNPDEQVSALAAAAAGRPVGLHVHHGPVTATSGERFVATAKAALAAVDFEPAFLNLGGAWHGIVDLEAALGELRAAIPRSIELIIEPGRAVAAEAGFACGRIVMARELADRSLRVADLSRICHLRWSQVELVGVGSRDAPVAIVGPTCFEDDVLGDWSPDTTLPAGARIAFRHVTGYALAWNHGFGGVPPADVIIAGA
jgi:diaminopimelate decarboxylase